MMASNLATRLALLMALTFASACAFDGSALDARVCGPADSCPDGSRCVEGLCQPVASDTAVDIDAQGDIDGSDTTADVDDDADASPDVSDVGVDTDAGCVPGAPVCSGDTLVTCLEDGTEERVRCSASEACPDAELGCFCREGACVPRTCAPGALRCDGDTVQRCGPEGARWFDERECAPDVCSGGSCIPAGCAADSVSCVGETVVTCGPDGAVADLESCLDVDAFCERTGDGAECTPWRCVPGQVACGDDPGEVMVCDATGRRFEPLETCAPGSACFEGVCAEGVCLPGAAYCADAFTLAQCDDAGSALERVPCADGFYCGERDGAAACIAQACEPGAARCAVGLAAVQVCNENGSAWGPAAACDEAQFCADGVCVDRVCTPGTVTCRDARNLQVCSPSGDRTEVVACAEGAFCDGSDSPALCRAGVCEPGTVSCDGALGVRTCDETGFGFEPTVACADGTACVDGACLETECSPGVTSCAGPFSVRVCDERGMIASETVCEPARYCDAGVCLPQVCLPGVRSCVDDATARVCDERGATSTTIACDDGQRCADGACLDVVCVPDSASCIDADTARRCNAAGTAFEDTDCAPGQRCDGGTCSDRVCTPDTVSCAGLFDVGSCNAAGTELTVTPCDDGSYCREGMCFEQVCTPSQARCATDFTVATCDERGSTETTEACTVGTRCDAGACIEQACSPDTLFCAGDEVRQCDAVGGSSSLIETCPETCRGGACVTAFCGDGVVDASAGEQCDDGNDDPCDGCDACQVDGTVVLTPASVSGIGPIWMPDDAEFTLELWARIEGAGGLIGVGSRSGAHIALYVDGDGRPGMTVSDGTDEFELTGAASVDDGVWHHLAAVRFQGGRTALYVDGRATALDLGAGGALEVSGDGRVWVGSDGVAPAATGQIDEVQFSAAARYEAGFTPPRRAVRDGDTIAAFACDGEGDVLIDASGGTALPIEGATRSAASCYGAARELVVCGDGGRAPWEACDGGSGCTGTCELPCAGERGPQGTCWFERDSLNNWSGARDACPEGADLLTVDDALEQAWLQTYYPGTERWIGLNDRDDEGTYEWADGSSSTYRAWRPGAPSSGGSGLFADCVSARASDLLWSDVSCLELHRAICERSPR